ncbi:MAG: ECF transporter S component [Bdellovibrionales bacterium]|nr:ECF transporter S component [Bdellovibrionales bacterium]
MNISRAKALFESLTIFEIVLTLVLAVALGVAFWGWTFVYDAFKPLLKVAGLSYLVAGFWILASILIPYIVRKPGVALMASIMAAFIESLLTHWGMMSLLWGLVQGLGAEIIFFMFFYRKWNLPVLMLAATLSSLFSYSLDYFLYDYKALSAGFNLLQLSSYIVSSIFLAGFLSYVLGQRLVRLGILDQFLIAKEQDV